MKKLLMLGISCIAILRGQGPNPPPYLLQLLEQPLPVVQSNQVGLTYSGTTGANTYCYFIVTRFAIGQSAASSPVCVFNGSPVGGGGSVAIRWQAPNIQTTPLYTITYDVIRLTTNSLPPNGVCSACLVASATSALTATDSLNILGSGYTFSPYTPQTRTISLDIISTDRSFMFDLTSGGIRVQHDVMGGVTLPTYCNAGQLYVQTGVGVFGCLTQNNWTLAGGGSVTNVTASAPLTSSGGATPNISANYQGNGGKVQASTGATVLNDCVKFDANGNTVDAGAPCGSGSIVLPSVSKTSGTVLTAMTGCSGASPPCNVSNGASVTAFSSTATATISAGSGTAPIFISATGVLSIGSVAGALTIVGAGFTVTTDSVVPNGATPLYTWGATVGTWDNVGGTVTDKRALIGNLNIAAGTGATVTYNGTGTPTIATDSTLIPIFQTGAGAPGALACAVGSSLYVDTTGHNGYYCTNTNSWSQMGGGSSNLGTTAAATSPSRSGQAGTGLYTAGSNLVDVATNSTQIAEFSNTGMQLFGNLGIGTAPPAVSKMAISTSGTGLFQVSDAGNGANWVALTLLATTTPTSTNYQLLASPTDGSFYLNRPSGGDMRFRENNIDQMSIQTSTGNLGIGTVSPGTKLDVIGTTRSQLYATATNCASGASPAVCAAAPDGAVAIPTGVNSTLVVNTTAVTANSRIFLTLDDSLTIAATTCNSTLATITGGVGISNRVAGTSFTISFNGTITTNPVCLSYKIEN